MLVGAARRRHHGGLPEGVQVALDQHRQLVLTGTCVARLSIKQSLLVSVEGTLHETRLLGLLAYAVVLGSL